MQKENPNWRVPFEGTWSEAPIEDGWKQAWLVHSKMPAKVLFPVSWAFRPDLGAQALVMFDSKVVCFSASGLATFKDVSIDKEHPVAALQIESACDAVSWGSQSVGRDLLLSRTFVSREEQDFFIRLLVDAVPHANVRRGRPGISVKTKFTVAFEQNFISETETGAFIR